MQLSARIPLMLCLALAMLAACSTTEEYESPDDSMREELCREAYGGPQECYP